MKASFHAQQRTGEVLAGTTSAATVRGRMSRVFRALKTLSGPSAWIGLSFGLLLAVSAVNVSQAVRRAWPLGKDRASPLDRVSPQEQRLSRLSRALADRGIRGIVAYIADLPPEKLRADGLGVQDYYLSQFVLVPWILDADRGDHKWAVSNLRGLMAADRIPAGYKVEQDFGDGVLLLHRASP